MISLTPNRFALGVGVAILFASQAAQMIGNHKAAKVIHDQKNISLSALAECLEKNKELLARGIDVHCPRPNIQILLTPINSSDRLEQR